MKNLITALDNCLPQTQCGECGFSGCMPYAEALAQKNTPINRCPPGGAAAVNNLAKLLGIDPEPYLAEAKARERKPAVAVIREEECIGCTKCIQACPVDAIFGAAKKLHSIISDECTGCGLCIDPCPVDCIDMHPIEEARYEPEKAKQRFQAKKIRQLQQEQAQQQSYREKKRLAMQAVNRKQEIFAKQDYILQALERVKNKRQSS